LITIDAPVSAGTKFAGSVLRKIVPVIAPDGHRYLEGDLEYFEANFGGVAWWPLSGVEASTDRLDLEKWLLTAFEKPEDLDFLERQVRKSVPSLCIFVCPERVGVRMAMGLVLAVVLVTLLVTLLGCGPGRLVATHPWLSAAVLAALVALLLALLVCDPVFKSRSTDILSGLLGVVVFGLLLRVWFRLKQGPLP